MDGIAQRKGLEFIFWMTRQNSNQSEIRTYVVQHLRNYAVGNFEMGFVNKKLRLNLIDFFLSNLSSSLGNRGLRTRRWQRKGLKGAKDLQP